MTNKYQVPCGPGVSKYRTPINLYIENTKLEKINNETISKIEEICSSDT